MFLNVTLSPHVLQAFALLKAREDELRKIRDGGLEATRHKPENKDKIKKRAFKKYWKIMHEHRRRPRIPDEDDFDPDYRTPDKTPEPPWEPELEPSHFFPHPSTAKPQELPEGAPVPIFVDQIKRKRRQQLEEDDEGMGSSLGERTEEEEEEEMEIEVIYIL